MKKAEKMESKFAGAKSFDAAAKLVLGKSVGYSFYQHYAGLESVLTKILQRRWFLTRCSCKRMNDLQEPVKYDGGTGLMKRSYVACFGHSMSESVAMWGLYGRSNPLALRVTIPGKTLERWMEEIESVPGRTGGNPKARLKAKTSTGATIAPRKISASVFRDMLYVAVSKKGEQDEYDIRRTNSVCWGNGYYRLKKDEDFCEDLLDGRCAGYLKDIEWRYEEETRLCIRLKNCIEDDNISIEVPPYVIEDMRFTFSPWLTADEDMRRVQCVLEAALKGAGVNIENRRIQRFRRSALQGALNFR